jgi:hypothetical protein
MFGMNLPARVFIAWWVSLQIAFVAGASETNSVPTTMLPSRSMLTMGGIATSPQRQVSPPFSGKTLPLPPKQNSAWAAPESNLPTHYVTATALLFEQGLADPRGCDYREIEVGTGNVWGGDGGVVKTHGWVLPGHGDSRFGICWNGLVYPLVAIGTNADLEADVALMTTNGMGSWRSALPESAGVAVNTPQGIHGCLLLRLGRPDWAANYWRSEARRPANYLNGMTRGVSPPHPTPATNEWQLPNADPYDAWANDWAWSLFDRMICAHERGDEKLALVDARRLTKIQPLIETACARRGFKRETSYGFQKPSQLQPYLNFLDQLPRILADLERREKEGVRVSAISRGLTNITDQTGRVRALVNDLDLVQARQSGQPGGVNLTEDPIVSALIAEGDAAVEPLLDCMDQDQRLTRSVSFGRDFHRGRNVLPVQNAAGVALQTILQAGFANAAEMRAYWNQYQHLKLEERWYAILADDTARNRWPEVAAHMVQPENVTRFPSGYTMEKPVPTNSAVKLRGECLRNKRNPSVTELLTRHAMESPTNNVGGYDLSACCQMAEYLARWDVQAALPVAKTLSKRACTVMKYSGQKLGDALTQLALARAKAGDASAFDEYAEWMVTTSPDQFERFNLDCFEPMKQFPTNLVLQAAAEKLFGEPDSAWGVLPWKNNFNWPAVDAGLIPMKGYRMLLCRELSKTNFCGSVNLERPGYLAYTLTDLHQSGSFGVVLPSSCPATNGSANSIRWCDWIALTVGHSKTNILFDPFASTESRDRAIRDLIIQLQ